MKRGFATHFIGLLFASSLVACAIIQLLSLRFQLDFWEQLCLSTVLVAAMSIGMCYRSIFQTERLLKEVQKKLLDFTQGNFNTSITAGSGNQGTHGIKDAFDSLKNMLNLWIYDLLLSSVSIKNSAGQMSTFTLQTKAGIEEMHHSLSNISHFVENTSNRLMEVASSTEELSATSQSIADNSVEIVSQVKKAQEVALVGGNSVDGTITALQEIHQRVSNSSEVIERLAKISEEIGYISNTISDISRQTNLLALNAAIESARAGEHGKGFAVVAEEVRKLADESNYAAGKINQLIQSINLESRNAVSSMGDVIAHVEGGVNIAADAGENLKHIIRTITEVVGLVQSISISAEEQSQSTGHIALSTEEVAAKSQLATSSVHEVASVVDRHLTVLQLNEQTSSNLLEVSVKLEDSMALFDKVIGEQMIEICDFVAELHQKGVLDRLLMEKIMQETGLSEIHITDENGMIFSSSVDSLVGFYFKYEAGSQTNDFLPILKDGSLKVNQKTMFRDCDGRLFKYTSVSTIGRPGIVQGGLEASGITLFKGSEGLKKLYIK